jgi:glycerophosphoryl diester phosphodiesterase
MGSTRFLDPEKPRLFGHRGFPLRYPENTLLSFRGAAACGLHYLELDVWLSGDGHLVVHHDETLERSCGRQERVADLSLARIKELDPGWGFVAENGERPFYGLGLAIPTLREVCSAFPDIFLNIEIKPASEAAAEALSNELQRAGALDRVLVAAFSDRALRRFRAVQPGVPTGLGRDEAGEFFERLRTGSLRDYTPPGEALQIPERHGETALVSPPMLQAAWEAGLEVHLWTVNDPQAMRSYLDWKVDGIMSDDAPTLARIAAERSGRP